MLVLELRYLGGKPELFEFKNFIYYQDEYEQYISLLLDLQEVQNDGGLLEKIGLLSEEATIIADDVDKEQKELDELEQQALDILDENER